MVSLKQANGKPVPGVAPAAIQMAQYTCKNILNDLDGKPRKDFKYFDKGSMATIGKSKAIVEAGKFKLTGFIAWLAWSRCPSRRSGMESLTQKVVAVAR